MSRKYIFFIAIALVIMVVSVAMVLLVNSLPKDVNKTYEGVLWDYAEETKSATFVFEGKLKKGTFKGTMTVISEDGEKVFRIMTEKSKDYTFITNCDLSSDKFVMGTVLTVIGDNELIIIDDGTAFCAPAKTAEQAEKLLKKYS